MKILQLTKNLKLSYPKQLKMMALPATFQLKVVRVYEEASPLDLHR